jgi:hypothetical protein
LHIVSLKPFDTELNRLKALLVWTDATLSIGAFERKSTIRLLHRDFYRQLLEIHPEGRVLDVGGPHGSNQGF